MKKTKEPTRPTLPKFNRKLYDKVIDHILEEPKRLDMSVYAVSPEDLEIRDEKRVPECGTVACFGGWAVALKHKWKAKKLADNYGELADLSREALGITFEESKVLFHVDCWPYETRCELDGLRDGTSKYAKVVAKFARQFRKQIEANREATKASREG